MNTGNEVILSDRYRLIRQLGQGASSTVYLAEHMKLKTYRAIKRISKSHPMQSQFRLEADLLLGLSHPSIPRLYDIEEDEVYLYLIEEYVEGESLLQYMLYHDSISQEYIMQIGIRLCEVLTYLHTRRPFPICYQDLKPEHIILCGDSIRIIDFGIASYITNQETYFQQLGTIGYAAPEQYSGAPIQLAADLYALGKVMTQLMGKAEWNCSKNLARITQKLVNEDPMARYQSAATVQLALEKELERVSHRYHKESKHLNEQIAVTGAKSGIGATHIAAAITAYLNQYESPSIYMSMHGEDIVETLIRKQFLTETEANLFERAYFKGRPQNGKIENENISENRILDYGCDLAACAGAQADYTILVLGGSEWEYEYCIRAYERLKYQEGLILICNYNHRQLCRKYAGLFDKRVYSFPFDSDAFVTTREKRRLFEKMLRTERGR